MKAHAVGDLLRTGDLQPLPFLQRGNKAGGLQHGVVGAGIEPRGAAAKCHHVELAAFKIEAVDVGDFQLAAG